MAEQLPAYLAPTFAERKAAREGKAAPDVKQVDDESTDVEDKAVAKKTTSRKTAKKS